MSIADTFKQFLSNIAVDNDDTISLRYGEVTAALNKKFRDTDSKVLNSLQVGSYGTLDAAPHIRSVSAANAFTTKGSTAGYPRRQCRLHA